MSLWENRCPFKIGDKVVCINDDPRITGAPVKGCVYEVIYLSMLYNNVGVRGRGMNMADDWENSCKPDWNDFISLKEYRKLKLERIDEKNRNGV